MEYYLEKFPDLEELLEGYDGVAPETYPKVNNHIHTPYSFSAFRSVEEAAGMAEEEEIRILGINDFNVTDGYSDFLRLCLQKGIFPLLNMEMIGISKKHQKQGIRINDPKNPGRTYISGKGMSYPSSWSAANREKLQQVVHEGNRQVAEMVDLVNRWCRSQEVDLFLSVEQIMDSLAENLLRERHVAKAIRLKLEEKATSEPEFSELLRRIYGGTSSGKSLHDVAGLEDEIRSKLLKAGAPAFVAEDVQAFPELNEIKAIISDGGGIPAYPILLDGAGGTMTEFEDGKEQLADSLADLGFHCVELIPMRNEFRLLKEYTLYLYHRGFSVSFGTEHNTTAMNPLTVSAKGQIPLDGELQRISYLGAACIAAHQYLVTKTGKNYPRKSRDEMEKIGMAVFQRYFQAFQDKN